MCQAAQGSGPSQVRYRFVGCTAVCVYVERQGNKPQTINKVTSSDNLLSKKNKTEISQNDSRGKVP